MSVSFGPTTRVLRFDVAGQRQVVREAWPGEPVEVAVGHGANMQRFTLVPRRRSSAEARDTLEVVAVRLPTDVLGQVDGARPADRVTLPSRWWRRALRASHLGFRPRDDQAPWAWQAITLHNTGAETIPLLIRGGVVDDAGEPVFAFRPRLRDAEGNSAVLALAQVPAGAEATVTLPLFVSEMVLPAMLRFCASVSMSGTHSQALLAAFRFSTSLAAHPVSSRLNVVPFSVTPAPAV